MNKKNKDKEETRIGTVCNCIHLNIRSSPDKNSDNIIVVIDRDDELCVKGIDDSCEWFSVVTADGINGFAMADYIAIVG